MNPRLIVLDYGGTLDRLDNPSAFVQAIKAQGDCPCLYTGSMLEQIRHLHPGLLDNFKEIHFKGRFTETADRMVVIATEIGAKEVVFVDDEVAYYTFILEDLNAFKHGGLAWTLVDARDIRSLLRDS